MQVQEVQPWDLKNPQAVASSISFGEFVASGFWLPIVCTFLDSFCREAPSAGDDRRGVASFGLRMAWASHGTCSKADCDLSVPGPLPSNSLLAHVCKFKRKNWTVQLKLDQSHQVWHSWEEVIQYTGLPGLCGKGRVAENGGLQQSWWLQISKL